jgi:hypothetical protein
VWFWLLRRYLVSPLGVFSFMTPLIGVAFGVWLLNEPLEPGFVACHAGARRHRLGERARLAECLAWRR